MMAKRAMPASAGPRWWMGVAAATMLLIPVAAAAGSWRPALVGSVGGTFAVLGKPDAGGASVSLAAMWPVAERLSFGVMLHGDDAGTLVDSLRDESGAGLDYGKIEQSHRAAWGVSWRLDAAARPRFGLTPTASATWGVYRVADDARGKDLGHVGSTGWSLAAGLRRDLAAHFALGAYVRYHRLFNDLEGRFVSAGLEGTWR
jgi:hypothetical protein